MWQSFGENRPMDVENLWWQKDKLECWQLNNVSIPNLTVDCLEQF